MKLLSNTRAHQLAYIAIMSALTIILSVLANFIPFMSIFLIVFLPFVAALVAIMCDLKLFPIYFFATILLSIVFDLPNFINIAFYLIPGLISGLVIGIAFRTKLHGIYLLLSITLVNFIANFATIPVLNFIYDLDVVRYSLKFIGFADHMYANEIFMGLLFVIGLIQASVTYLIVDGEISLIKGKIRHEYERTITYVTLILVAATIISNFLHLGIALVFFCSTLVLTIYQLIYLLNTQMKYGLWVLGISIVMIPISLVLNELHQAKYMTLYLLIPLLMIVIGTLLWEYIFKRRVN